MKLYGGNIHDATRLIDLYLEYIKTLQTIKQKEDEVSRLSLGFLRIQIHLKLDADNILQILNRMDDEDGIPFNTVFLKIWTCISEPDSIDAQKYLNDLIESQIQGQDDEYALKSLCNIAKQCADMYRPDFEHKCLRIALEINDQDAWTLIQWGDHLKRLVSRLRSSVHDIGKTRS